MIGHTEPSNNGRRAKMSACKQYLVRAPERNSEMTEPHRNVLGIGIGPKLKEEGGKLVAVAPEAIRFYVERKIKRRHDIRADHLLREEVDGMPTDVIEVGRLRCSAVPHAPVSFPAIQPGTSCGVRFGRCGDGATGTIGAIVVKDGKRHILGSAHVLARANGFLFGTPILCPGPVDLPLLADEHRHGHGPDKAHAMHPLPGETSFRRARLADFRPLYLDRSNTMDAAIAEIISDDIELEDDIKLAILDIGKLASNTPAKAAKGMRVSKRGIATGLTHGTVLDTDFDGRVDFPLGPLMFQNQILIQGDNESPFAWEGDSGSLVVTHLTRTEAGKVTGEAGALPLGLVIGFSMPEATPAVAQSFCIATELSSVLNALHIELLIS